MCHEFDSTGDYEIRVRLRNALSNLEETIQVKVQHPVLDLHLSALNSVLGEESSLFVSVHGSYQFSIGLEIDWNDGTKSSLDGDDLQIWVCYHHKLQSKWKLCAVGFMHLSLERVIISTWGLWESAYNKKIGISFFALNDLFSDLHL